jgi:hypothetical protein
MLLIKVNITFYLAIVATFLALLPRGYKCMKNGIESDGKIIGVHYQEGLGIFKKNKNINVLIKPI